VDREAKRKNAWDRPDKGMLQPAMSLILKNRCITSNTFAPEQELHCQKLKSWEIQADGRALASVELPIQQSSTTQDVQLSLKAEGSSEEIQMAFFPNCALIK
jgi:hypothetical protein